MLATFVLWLGCMLVFLASPHQKLTQKRPLKGISWGAFIFLTIISWLMFCAIYSMVIAAIVVLALVMTMWTAIVLVHGHVKTRLMPFFIIGSAVSVFIVKLGEWHVAT